MLFNSISAIKGTTRIGIKAVIEVGINSVIHKKIINIMILNTRICVFVKNSGDISISGIKKIKIPASINKKYVFNC